MPILRYLDELPVNVKRHAGNEHKLQKGDEIDLTDEEAAGCACRPERPDGIWERVQVFGPSKDKGKRQ